MNCPDCNRDLSDLSVGEWPFRCFGQGHSPNHPLHCEVHPSERCVVLMNEAGDIRIPGRNDRPIHPKYAAAGFVKVEMHPKEVARRTGKISEVWEYDQHSARADRDYGCT